MFIKNFCNNKKIVITIFIVLIVIFIAISFVFFNKISDDSDTDINFNSDAVTEEQTKNNILSGDSTFLVVIANESNEVVLPFLADFKIYSGKIILTKLESNTLCADGRTYAECYSYGGINTLRSNVEKTRNVKIDRYVVMNKSGFSKLTELMGEVVLYTEEDFTYATSDKIYAVSEGKNEMGSDMLYTYISLLAGSENKNQDVITIISEIINTYIENIDSSDYEKMFGDVTNCFTTDLTISDFYTAKSDIEYLVNNNFSCVLAENVDG